MVFCTYAFYNAILYGNFYFLTCSFFSLLLLSGRKHYLQDDIQLHIWAPLVNFEVAKTGNKELSWIGDSGMNKRNILEVELIGFCDYVYERVKEGEEKMKR